MQVKYKNFRSSRRFGIEIELGVTVPKKVIINAIENCSNHKVRSLGYNKSINNKVWHVKVDGTCGSGDYTNVDGWEVASFVGRGPQDIIHMGDVATAIKDSGAKVNLNCGMHVHAEVLDIDKVQAGIILARWIKIERILVQAISQFRNLNFCAPISYLLEETNPDLHQLGILPEDLYNCLVPERGDDPSDFRYRSINIVNYYLSLKRKNYKRKTFELRLPESSLEQDNIIGWLRLFLNFIEYNKHSTMPSSLKSVGLVEALKILGLWHDDQFYIFGAALNKTRIWFLKRIIENSIRKNLKAEARKILRSITPI